MAVYRNKSDETLTPITGFSAPREIPPDETFEVSDDLIENWDLNPHFVRVDGSAAPPRPVDAPASPEAE